MDALNRTLLRDALRNVANERIDEETKSHSKYSRISIRQAKKLSEALGIRVHWRPSAKQVIAILVAATMLLLTGCGIAYRNEIREFIIKAREGGVRITFSKGPSTERKPINECYNFDFVPEGFTLEQVSQLQVGQGFFDHVKIQWSNSSGQFIYLHIVPADSTIFDYDNEHGQSEIRQISSHKVYCYMNDKVCLYLWNDGEYSIELFSNCQPDDDLITQIALGIKK